MDPGYFCSIAHPTRVPSPFCSEEELVGVRTSPWNRPKKAPRPDPINPHTRTHYSEAARPMPPALQDRAAAAMGMGPPALIPPPPGEESTNKGKCRRPGAPAAGAQQAQGGADRAAATQRVSNVPGTFNHAPAGP